MIDEKKLAELRARIHDDNFSQIEVIAMADTIEKLWRVARMAEVVMQESYEKIEPWHKLRDSLAALEEGK